MELEETIETLKAYKKAFITKNDYLDSVDTVLEELNNRIPRKDIGDRLSKFKNKQKELDEEGFYGRYKKYGGKQKFEKYYAYINGTMQAYEELLDKE